MSNLGRGRELVRATASPCLLLADSREGAYITVLATPGVAHRRSLAKLTFVVEAESE